MISYYLSIMGVIYGLIFFSVALFDYLRLFRTAAGRRQVRNSLLYLMSLIGLFYCGYIAVLGFLISNYGYFAANEVMVSIVAAIFFFGAVFVWSNVDLMSQMLAAAYGREADIVAGLPIALALVDRNGRLDFLNQAALRLMTSLGEKAAVGASLLQMPFVAKSGLTETVRAGLRGQAFDLTVESVFPLVSSRRWLHFKGTPVLRSDAVLKYLVFMVEDVTAERDLAEAIQKKEGLLEKEVASKTEELQRRMDELQRQRDNLSRQTAAMLNVLEDIQGKEQEVAASEAKYRAFIENSADLIFSVDARGVINYISPQAVTMGYQPEEMIGRPFFDFLLPDEKIRVAAVFGRAVETGREVPLEIRVRHKDGTVHWMEQAGKVQRDASGKIIGMIGVLRNIDERKTVESRVKELSELKNRFIQVVSHQLRTPLNAVRWNLETILSGNLGQVAETQKEFVQISYTAVVDIISRVGDVLTAMDIEEGRVIFEAEPVSLESLVGSMLIDFRVRCGLRETRLDYQPPAAPLPELRADTAKLRSALEKLLNNALAYTPPGGSITVRLALTPENTARFEVSDTGIGIPLAEQKRVFERFFRASNASALEPNASGLGLSIARFYVDQHRGKIGFLSQEGKGSLFWVELPLTAAA